MTRQKIEIRIQTMVMMSLIIFVALKYSFPTAVRSQIAELDSEESLFPPQKRVMPDPSQNRSKGVGEGVLKGTVFKP